MFPCYSRTFKLGSLYEITSPYGPRRIVKFIKVTRKGYNLLDMDTHKCILRGHLYSPLFSHKEIPDDVVVVRGVLVREWLTLKEFNEVKV